MGLFQMSDPFPAFDSRRHTYGEAQAHAARVDEWLGLQTQKIETKLALQGCRVKPDTGGEKQQLWFGLEVQSLLTPYMEIRSMLETLSPGRGETVVDLGAAYARMAFVIARHFPEVKFVGYEYVGERVAEAERCLARLCHPNVTIEHADLSSPTFKPVPAEYYFIYDYGTPKAIEKTLHDLRRVANERAITLIGRGRHCRYMIESRHPWLRKLDPHGPEGRVTFYTAEPYKEAVSGF